MMNSAEPARRSLLLGAAAAPLLLAAPGLSACGGPSETDRQLTFRTLAAAEDELSRLQQSEELASAAVFTWAQTLVHCAQSIEFSMAGFPQPKPALFQHTVGAAAIAVFSWRGRMTHDLAEPIPGAPALEAQADPTAAADRLRRAVAAFRAWTGPLKPHFAYGELDKPTYELAHAMHLANHFSGFRPAA
jgi:Protein of unknown function (DUF1569)